jgi:predicted ATP-grasp superfamily ATP-dependent carboligase
MVGDARAALQLVETINTLLGDKVNIDIGQLKDTAEDVEAEVKKAVESMCNVAKGLGRA